MNKKQNIIEGTNAASSIKPTIDGYTVLPTVPFRAIDKTNSAYRNIVVTEVNEESVLAHSTFADGYRKFERKLLLTDIEIIPIHNCNPDSFNKHCQTCGKYCG